MRVSWECRNEFSSRRALNETLGTGLRRQRPQRNIERIAEDDGASTLHAHDLKTIGG